jgi:hypothetical protein
MDPVTVIGADALTGLRTLPDNSANCLITSPPYLALRDYGLKPIWWDYEQTRCDHQLPESNTGFCLKGCGAWRGCLGLEPTPDLYVKHLVDIAREARRVLHPSGTFWLVISDSFFGDSPVRLNSGESFTNEWSPGTARRSGARLDRLKPKDLVGIPWAVAFALRDDGWWLRCDVIEEVEIYCPCCGHTMEERIWRHGPDREIIWHKAALATGRRRRGPMGKRLATRQADNRC